MQTCHLNARGSNPHWTSIKSSPQECFLPSFYWLKVSEFSVENLLGVAKIHQVLDCQYILWVLCKDKWQNIQHHGDNDKM
jgi:hypothetical protein